MQDINDSEVIAEMLWPEHYAIYRVMAVTSSENDPYTRDFEIGVSAGAAGSYCLPSTVFYLSEEGFEDPKTSLIGLNLVSKREFINTGHRSVGAMFDIEFEWDGGKYVGRLVLEQNIMLPWLNGQDCHARIVDISSL